MLGVVVPAGNAQRTEGHGSLSRPLVTGGRVPELIFFVFSSSASKVGFVCVTVSLLVFNKVFFFPLYGVQDGGLLVTLGYPATSAEPAEREICWVRSLGRCSRPSSHRPWESLFERSVSVQ